MTRNNFSTVLDFGSSSFRLGVFDENLNNLYSSSKNIFEKNNYEEHFNSIKSLIKDAEKKTSNHLDNITVLYDSAEIYSIDISIKKIFDKEVFVKDIYYSIILEANQLVKDNHINKKIIHIILSKILIDGKALNKNLDKIVKAKSIVLETKFICISLDKFNKILNVFKKNNLQVLNFFCSSYVKSLSYLSSLNANELVAFLDIGFEKSILLLFSNSRLIFINSIPLGGNHITKDISNVMELNLDQAENIKKLFNKSENEFSYNEYENDNKLLIKEIIDKEISVTTLKKVILARVEEIFDLIFKDLIFLKHFSNKQNFPLVLTGKGSKLFDKNTFHLNDKYSFKEIIFYNETDQEICKAGIYSELNLEKSDIKIIQKSAKKYGIFEKFFNFFGK